MNTASAAYSIAKIASAHVAEVPIAHAIVDDFFPSDLLHAMLERLPRALDADSFWDEVFNTYSDPAFARTWHDKFPNLPKSGTGSTHLSNCNVTAVHGWSMPLTAAVFLDPSGNSVSLTRFDREIKTVITVPCIPNRLLAFPGDLTIERTDRGNAVICWPFHSEATGAWSKGVDWSGAGI